MTDETLQNQQTQMQQEPAQTQESNDLNVHDLNGMKTIIDIASSRGAFKPNEMMAVGQIYNKLTNFLASVTKQTPQAGA